MRVIGSAAIPKAIFATQWDLPSFPALNELPTTIMQGTWGSRARMRCLQILMTVSYDPTRIEPLFATLYRTFTLLRRILLESVDRYNMFCGNVYFSVSSSPTLLWADNIISFFKLGLLDAGA